MRAAGSDTEAVEVAEIVLFPGGAVAGDDPGDVGAMAVFVRGVGE
jgi:hypothetical protein